MPGIILFNRRWNFASDDLFYPSLFEIGFRGVWLTFQVVIYILHNEKFHCADLNLLEVYYIGFLCTIISIIVVQTIILYVSSLGTITNDKPRRHMTIFIYIRIILMIFEFIWSIIGVKWLITVRTPVNCSTLVFFDVLANIIFCFIAIFILISIMIVLIDPISHLPNNEISLRRNRILTHMRTLFCCCSFFVNSSKNRNAIYTNSYKQISSILELIFRGGDLTPSDITAGLLLLSEKEMHQYEREAKFFNDQTPPCVDFPYDWMNVNEASYYVRYAMAIYSWPYYIYMNSVKGFCQLCCNIKCSRCCCCCCFKSRRYYSNTNIHGDNKCNCYYDAFKRIAKLKDCDVIYANFRNDLFQSPFFIAMDHYKKKVIISIRGTLSLRDVITDITAECGHIDVNDDLKNEKCHIGILNTAENIYMQIKKDNLLEKAFEYNRNYELLITGHSLGAGAAAILGLKLQSEYPTLRVVCYSPPGGLLSEKLADYTKSFILSVIIGDDIIARLSIRAIHDLKARILTELYAVNMPKYKILCTSMKFLCEWVNLKRKTQSVDELIRANDNDDINNINAIDDLDVTSRVQTEQAVQHDIIDMIDTHEDEHDVDETNSIHKKVANLLKVAYETYDELQLPGKILYIYRIRENKKSIFPCFRHVDAFDLRMAERSEFKNIRPTKYMFIDHLPNRVEDALKFFYQFSENYI